jgi:AcrR family transcriptional regulator
MTPRPDVSEERRGQIVESAAKVFARDGFAHARMDDIAAESGLSKGLLYWYFKSKDEIIVAIADLLLGSELRKIEKLSCDGLSASCCLMKFMDIFIEDLAPILSFRSVTYEFYALAFRNKAIRLVMQQCLQQFITIIEAIVQRGIKEGEFSGDAHQAALAIGAILEGTLVLWVLDSEMVNIEAQLRAGMALILEGLRSAAQAVATSSKSINTLQKGVYSQ